ncbi:MAG: FtsQ-type POTRA domain-containing protein, partial [Gammaproteobacteria bacterium]
MIRIFKKLTIISIKLLFAAGLIISVIGYINKFQKQYPVVKLKLLGELDYIDQKDIELLLGDLLLNNLWTLNLNVVKDKLMLNSWIDQLILKKCWPTKLEVSIVYNK